MYNKFKPLIIDFFIIVSMLIFIISTSYNYWNEVKQLPVLVDMEVIDGLKYDPQTEIWYGKIQGVKQRNCIFIPNEVIGLTSNGKQWIQTDFFATNDPTPRQSGPVGFQSFNIWNWKGNSYVKEVKVISKHICLFNGKDIAVYTTIGPFITY